MYHVNSCWLILCQSQFNDLLSLIIYGIKVYLQFKLVNTSLY